MFICVTTILFSTIFHLNIWICITISHLFFVLTFRFYLLSFCECVVTTLFVTSHSDLHLDQKMIICNQKNKNTTAQRKSCEFRKQHKDQEQSVSKALIFSRIYLDETFSKLSYMRINDLEVHIWKAFEAQFQIEIHCCAMYYCVLIILSFNQSNYVFFAQYVCY